MLLNCGLQGKSERGRERVGGKGREKGREIMGVRKGGKTDGGWRERERTINNSEETGCQVSFGC